MSLLALELETFSGIPLHPLAVHLPVVLVPLALLGAVVALARPAWRSWALPVVAFLTAGSLVGIQLAIMSGEGLEEILDEEDALIETHAQLAEQARPLVFLFFVLATAAAAAYWLIKRDAGGESEATEATPRVATLRKMLVPLCALSVLFGALSTVWVYRTGHTGAESVWKGEGGDGDSGDDGDDGDKGGDEKPAPAPDEDDDGD